MPNTEVGFFSFTEAPLAYDRPEGVGWAQRWVATPELMDRRLFVRGDLIMSRFVTLCLMSEPLITPDAFHRVGRLFEGKRSNLSGLFTLVKAYAAPKLTVDANAILGWPNRGLFVTAQDRAQGATAAAVDDAREWYNDVHIPDLLGVHGVAGCWWFEAVPDDEVPGGPDARSRTIRVYWLDEDPNAFLDDLKAKTPGMPMIDLSAAYRTLLVGAYRTMPVGSGFDGGGEVGW